MHNIDYDMFDLFNMWWRMSIDNIFGHLMKNINKFKYITWLIPGHRTCHREDFGLKQLNTPNSHLYGVCCGLGCAKMIHAVTIWTFFETIWFYIIEIMCIVLIMRSLVRTICDDTCQLIIYLVIWWKPLISFRSLYEHFWNRLILHNWIHMHNIDYEMFDLFNMWWHMSIDNIFSHLMKNVNKFQYITWLIPGHRTCHREDFGLKQLNTPNSHLYGVCCGLGCTELIHAVMRLIHVTLYLYNMHLFDTCDVIFVQYA